MISRTWSAAEQGRAPSGASLTTGLGAWGRAGTALDHVVHLFNALTGVLELLRSPLLLRQAAWRCLPPFAACATVRNQPLRKVAASAPAVWAAEAAAH